ncbi:hypothetical protein N7463_006268 [Penicillium fimorum]|uniref:Uncharacterized protein n=1 Tax=Penicillium fimorum TaxID=1882269 RepID=A0A9W9XU58_9EURO|nr:hypothetical protein N7463_006268 [Penicillium fimorum]
MRWLASENSEKNTSAPGHVLLPALGLVPDDPKVPQVRIDEPTSTVLSILVRPVHLPACPASEATTLKSWPDHGIHFGLGPRPNNPDKSAVL